jgi:formylglycine-generating enzyme required for sulfatase activity
VRDSDIVEVGVYGIEMVYVPQGAFYVGDGDLVQYAFEDGNSGQPFRITSEAALTLGGSQLGNLSVNTGSGDDFDYFQTRTLPAAFPKGFDAFYCMKYELSGQQYADFMKTLDPAGMSTRLPSVTINSTTYSGISLQNASNGNVVAKYPWLPIYCINWGHMAAYLDWAGLRPLSELEFEKACRGPEEPIEDEYAWGNTTWAEKAAITDGDDYVFEDRFGPNEMVVEGLGEGIGNACSRSSVYYPVQFPPWVVRCGIYAASAKNKTRVETRATYYGIMEMTGNVYEFCIGVGNSQTRDFSGLHGDGNLSSSSNASFSLLSDWTFVAGNGLVLKDAEVSERTNVNTTSEDRYAGIRGCRTAP